MFFAHGVLYGAVTSGGVRYSLLYLYRCYTFDFIGFLLLDVLFPVCLVDCNSGDLAIVRSRVS